MNTICRILSPLSFALVWAALTLTGYAQTGNSYIFPGITTNNDITIGNLNPVPTTATVAFYDNSGKLNSLSLELASGTQTRVNPATVALQSFTGSVVISSAIPLSVSADQFEGNTAFDFIYPSPLSTTLLIPITAAEGASVEVDVFNPGPNQAEVKVVLVQSNGAHNEARTATVDPLHSNTFNLGTSAAASYAFVTTSNILRPVSPVAAAAVIRNFAPGASVAGAATRTDFAVAQSTPANIYTKTTEVPFFAQGPDYFTLVQIDNLSNSTQTISVTATQADGTPFPGTSNPASIVLPPYGAVRQEMAQMFGSTSIGFATGTISAVSQGTLFSGNPTGGPPAPITASVAIGNLSQPGFAVLTPVAAQTTFALQLRGTGREFFTGLSIRNPGANDAHALLTFVLDQGTTLSSETITVPHGKSINGTLADLFPEAVGNGYILVNSDVPITIVGLDGRSDNTALAARLPVYASPQFTPAPQQDFLIVGTVRDQNSGINGQNIGVPNVALVLSGPVEATTATDLAGTYSFHDLPPGRYTLTPLPVGFTASPGGTTVVITNTNSHNNDFAIGLTTPGIQTINPASAQLVSSNPGSSAAGLPVAVQGTNFVNPTTFTGNIFTQNINQFTTGTVFVFADSQVPTSVSSPTFLTATVPSSLLVTTGTVQVRVRNLGPSGDFVDSVPFSFIVGSAPPQLTSVTGVPSPLIAGKVTSSFQVTVNGSGFTPATRVRVNFIDRPTTFVNQNQVLGTVLPADLTIPGFVPITVQNPNTVDSTPFQMPLLYPIPALAQISPNQLTAQLELNAQPILVTLSGTDFSQSPTNPLDTAVVQVNGTAIPTQYISTTQLTALIPPNLTAVPGVLQIAVANPTPNLASSNAQPLFVNNPVATITSVNGGGVSWNPNSPPNDFFIQSIVITGQNFSPNAVAWVNLPCDKLGLRQALSTVRNSAEQVIANIPIRCAGTYSLAVANPQPGGGLSAPANLVVPSVAAATGANATTLFFENAVPAIASIDGGAVSWNPNTPAGQTINQSVVITGTNFLSTSVVWVDSPCDSLGLRQALSTVLSGPNQIVATIPIGCAGTYSIAVANPAPGGGFSGSVSLVVSSMSVAMLSDVKSVTGVKPALKPALQSGFTVE